MRIKHREDIPNTLMRIPEEWKQLMLQLGEARHVYRTKPDEAFGQWNTLLLAFLQIFHQGERWMLPILLGMCKDLKSVCQDASQLEESARTLNRGFSICATDRYSSLSTSRKWGAYAMANLLFQSYFKLGSLHLCKNILKSLDSADLPGLSQYPMADQVTFQFYTGVLAFYDLDFVNAERKLGFTYKNLPKECKSHQTLTLHYLIPSRLVQAQVPSPAIYESDPALNEIYGPFVEAIQTGNVGLFDKQLETTRQTLILKGTWLTMEQVRALCVRSLFKIVYKIYDSTRIPFQAFEKALGMSTASSLEGVECLLVNLIDKGYIKGYLSHERQMAVLSAKDPFPELG
ncbi:hypothetical protein EDD86DRAFT_188451 [Gorgonomyces haynaldii]|nr:hypothetical protein EDD86DRAFT_188451 [Gorgonomyces haynaldii]